MSDTSIIILAAGKGTRMKSELPKVLHPVNGRPMIIQILLSMARGGFNNFYPVIGYQADQVKDALIQDREVREAGIKLNFIYQYEQLGTGHAVMQAGDILKNFIGNIIILNGDVPLLRPETLNRFLEAHNEKNYSASVLTAVLDDAASYGRIIRNSDGEFQSIVEFADASEEEKKVNEINTGTYCYNSEYLWDALDKISDSNNQGEYYLTDTLKLIRDSGGSVNAAVCDDPDEVIGVNSVADLAKVEKILSAV